MPSNETTSNSPAESQRTNVLGTAPIGGLFLKFAIPAVTSTMIGALYNIVDRIFIGQGVGELGIAATTVAFPIMNLIMAFSFVIGNGGNATLAIKLGEGKRNEAEDIVGNCFTTLIIISLCISVTGLLFLEPILRAFAASDAVLPYAKTYMSIIFMGTVFQVLSLGMNNFIRTQGSPVIAMLTMVAGAVLNCILDPLFIFVFELGVAGAAYATIISQFVSASIIVWYLTKGPSIIKIRRHALKPRIKLIIMMASLGISSFIVQTSNSLVNTVSNNSLLYYGNLSPVGGDGALAAFGIILNIASLAVLTIVGMLQALQPIVGYNFGAKKYGRVVRALLTALASAFCMLLILWIVFQLFPVQIIRLFGLEEGSRLMEFTVWALRTDMSVIPLVCVQIIGLGYFQATGRPKQASLVSLSRQIFLLVPFMLIFPLFFGLNGVVFAFPASDLLSALIVGAILFVDVKRLRRLDHAVETAPVTS